MVGFLGLQIPVAAYIAIHHEELGWGRPALWWSLVLTSGLAACLYVYIWHRGHWRFKKIR